MLTKKEYINALDRRKEAYENIFKVSVIERDNEFYEDIDTIQQLINDHFNLQLTRSECDLIEFALRPLEEELGMDVTLLIDKIQRIQSTLPKEEGVVESVEFEID